MSLLDAIKKIVGLSVPPPGRDFPTWSEPLSLTFSPYKTHRSRELGEQELIECAKNSKHHGCWVYDTREMMWYASTKSSQEVPDNDPEHGDILMDFFPFSVDVTNNPPFTYYFTIPEKSSSFQNFLENEKQRLHQHIIPAMQKIGMMITPESEGLAAKLGELMTVGYHAYPNSGMISAIASVPKLNAAMKIVSSYGISYCHPTPDWTTIQNHRLKDWPSRCFVDLLGKLTQKTTQLGRFPTITELSDILGIFYPEGKDGPSIRLFFIPTDEYAQQKGY